MTGEPSTIYQVARSHALAVFATVRRTAGSMLVLLPVLLGTAYAHAAPLSGADEKAIQGAIAGQLAAFAGDDAQKAYAYAAPNVKAATRTAAAFLTMVRRDYPVVYRPRSVAFLKPEGKDGEAVQRVQMTDLAGDSWLAIYTLQRQKDKLWRITGCAVLANKGRMA